MDVRIFISGSAVISLHCTAWKDKEGRQVIVATVDGLKRVGSDTYSQFRCTFGPPETWSGPVSLTDRRWLALAKAALSLADSDGFDMGGVAYAGGDLIVTRTS